MDARRLSGRLTLALCLAAAAPAFAQVKPYVPKHGVLNWKAVIFGGAFRVMTIIPLHGDFSKYDRLEIVKPESLIGPDVPSSLLARLTDGLVTEFGRGKRFDEVVVVDSFTPAPPPAAAATSRSFRDADTLDAPMRTWADLVAFDRQREVSNRDTGTIVIRSEVIDYAKGNKALQLVIDLGNAVLTLRFSFYDKITGEELGRTIISSDNGSKVIPSLFSTRSPLTGIAEGLVDQLTRRKVASER